MKTLLMTDSCSDLPIEYVKQNNIAVLSLTFNFRGKTYEDNLGQSVSYKEFYDGVRNGEMPSTSQINSFTFLEAFKKYVKQGYSVLYIAISSALSGTYNSALMARTELLEENPDADITVIDSKCASMGQGLLVYSACEKLKDGISKDALVDWIEDNKLKLNHWFTVDDLHHLKRGGRISATSAVIGTLLDIKPILYVDIDGKLAPVTKVKGRKKSVKSLAEELRKRIIDPENQVIGISHGDCLEDAKMLEKIIHDEFNVRNVLISHVGPVVGSHSGPGTLALFFYGSRRDV